MIVCMLSFFRWGSWAVPSAASARRRLGPIPIVCRVSFLYCVWTGHIAEKPAPKYIRRLSHALTCLFPACAAVKSIQLEIKPLEELCRQMYLELVEMREEQVRMELGPRLWAFCLASCLEVILATTGYMTIGGVVNWLLSLQSRLEFSQTWLGRFYNVQGLFFSVYCVYKILMVWACEQNTSPPQTPNPRASRSDCWHLH
jgi:hypothetical protein